MEIRLDHLPKTQDDLPCQLLSQDRTSQSTRKGTSLKGQRGAPGPLGGGKVPHGK